MVGTLSAFADEVTRVAREVGTEGRLGGQADVKGVGRHLEGPDRRRRLDGAEPDRSGARHRPGHYRGRQWRDLSKKIDVDARGEILELKTTINTMVDGSRPRSPPR